MKLIDRYVARGFILRFVLAHVVLFGLYVSFDAMKRLDQIRAGGLAETVPRVAAYYAYQFPTRVLDTVPPLLLLGAGLLLMQMSRRGELLTLKAGGVSLHRIVLPIFLCTLPFVVLIFWTRERVVPWCYRRQALLDRQLERKSTGPFLLSDREEDYKLYVATYDFGSRSMSRVTVIDFHQKRGPGDLVFVKRRIDADSGGWMENGDIYLEKVTVKEYDREGALLGPPRAHATKHLETSLLPFDFVEAKQDTFTSSMPALTLEELRKQMRDSPRNPRFKVMFHGRLSAPVEPFVLLLIGIPLLIGFEHSMKSRAVGAIVCIVVAGAYQVLSFVALSMGTTGLISAPVAAWSVPAIGGVVGLGLFGSMRT